MSDTTSALPVLLRLQQRAISAVDRAELAFIVANESWQLVPYRQAAVFAPDLLEQPQLLAVSGLISAFEDTPFTLWLRRLCKALIKQAEPPGQIRPLTAHAVADEFREGWAEWWPEHALFCPLQSPSGRVSGYVLYVRDEPWQDVEIDALSALHPHYGFCLQTFQKRQPKLREYWTQLRQQPKRLKRLAAILAAIALMPVPMSVVAPAEIIALTAETVAAPTDGVVKTFHRQPNQTVKQGDLLFSLDDTTLRNRRDIAVQALAVARADALTAGQKAFDNAQSKSDLANLQGKVREKDAEVVYLDELLGRIDVHASHDGIFIYGDPNDWIGKPVVTGERIAQLAQPDDLGVLVWLSVGDAITLEPGARIRVYLQVSPLNALSATLIETSYQATLSPDNVAAYRVRGKLESGEQAHIGLRGVAKVYGGWRPLAYWIMRRPLGAMRQWIGL